MPPQDHTKHRYTLAQTGGAQLITRVRSIFFHLDFRFRHTSAGSRIISPFIQMSTVNTDVTGSSPSNWVCTKRYMTALERIDPTSTLIRNRQPQPQLLIPSSSPGAPATVHLFMKVSKSKFDDSAAAPSLAAGWGRSRRSSQGAGTTFAEWHQPFRRPDQVGFILTRSKGKHLLGHPPDSFTTLTGVVSFTQLYTNPTLTPRVRNQRHDTSSFQIRAFLARTRDIT